MIKATATLGLALVLAACASHAPATAPAPAPVPAGVPAATIPGADTLANAPRSNLQEAPRDWQLLDERADGVPGISVRRAERELLAGKQPRRTVIVAVIDGGIDTAHVDLRANLWTNPRETSPTTDGDGDGHVGDTWGWNFLGGANGKSVNDETLEVTRVYNQCRHGGPARDSLGPPVDCTEVARDFERRRTEAQQQLPQIVVMDSMMRKAVPLLRTATGTDSLTFANVRAVRPADAQTDWARRVFLQFASQGISPKDVTEARKELQSRLDVGLNTEYDARATIVKDDTTNLRQTNYGNRDATGPDASHGTHVAGIIGAVRGNGIGVDGVATAVKLMSVRAVPNGDERDKDIANAIRYAVDHGANVINMSFGKGFSPQKRLVDDAVKYADARGVLMVHAAGNDGEDLATSRNFPTPAYLDGGTPKNWIEVGASSWKGGDSLAASFSNYNRKMVDVFAPGVDILSTVPGNGYERESGTSMASPVVTGLAALIMSYYPDLDAAAVKRIILASAHRHDQSVVRPGATMGEHVPFSSLSATGGIVNAYDALRLAAQESHVTP